jgi:hypothetical protein
VGNFVSDSDPLWRGAGTAIYADRVVTASSTLSVAQIVGCGIATQKPSDTGAIVTWVLGAAVLLFSVSAMFSGAGFQELSVGALVGGVMLYAGISRWREMKPVYVVTAETAAGSRVVVSDTNEAVARAGYDALVRATQT